MHQYFRLRKISGMAAGLLPLFCFTLGAAQMVSLTGTVKTSAGAAVPGARVNLQKFPHLTATTDAAGAFALSGNAAGIIRSGAARTPATTFVKGRMLNFTIAGAPKPAAVEVFDKRGVKVFSRSLGKLATGKHGVSLALKARGFHLIRLTVGSEVQVLKMVSGSGIGHYAAMGSGNASGSVSPLAKKSAEGMIDTVVVTAPGFKHALVGVTAYSQEGLEGILAASNPWKPVGPLEKDKGMVKILAKGKDFEMGQPNPHLEGEDFTEFEQPVRTVDFTYDFWMDTSEVRQSDYDSLMKAAHAAYQTPHWLGGYGLGPRYPAYLLEWGDAALYLNARSKRDGLDTVYKYTSITGTPGALAQLNGLTSDLTKNGYRLPTEAEWEYVARAGAAGDFHWGKNFPYPATDSEKAEFSEYAVWKENSWDRGAGEPGYGMHPVGEKKPNAYGVYDIIGNAFEWCQDWFALYRPGTATDPAGPADGEGRALRGGSWGHEAFYLRASNRIFTAPDYHYYFIGFRAVRRVL